MRFKAKHKSVRVLLCWQKTKLHLSQATEVATKYFHEGLGLWSRFRKNTPKQQAFYLTNAITLLTIFIHIEGAYFFQILLDSMTEIYIHQESGRWHLRDAIDWYEQKIKVGGKTGRESALKWLPSAGKPNNKIKLSCTRGCFYTEIFD